MTQALTFGQGFIAAAQSLANDMKDLRVFTDRITQDPTLLAAYLGTPGARTDLLLGDLQALSGAITQLLFTWDTGSPATKELFYKVE
jgi:hypothetical protein